MKTRIRLALVAPQFLKGLGAAVRVRAAAASGAYPDVLTRTEVRAGTGSVLSHITNAIDILVSAHGAGSSAEVDPLQRIWRNANVAARHAVTLPAVNYEIYGKALLGCEDQIIPLI
ncbi:MAG: hypothetical protein ACRDTS_12910 [Mycobacterium sp.]